jgi:UDP-N-acetylglucosamine 1-carboxyvinyltransferase
MDCFVIQGGTPLEGTLRINGSKNATLPLMAACLLTDEPVTLHDCPDLSDTRNMLRLLGELGADRLNERPPGITESEADDPYTVVLQADPTGSSHARYDIVRTMRAGICVLGPLLARRGEARVSLPGGCAIGDRPIDLHLRGLEALGATIELDDGDVTARAPAGGRLRGATLFLGGPNGSTVLGTANVMSAAALAEGTTIIECAACEPEIVDVANLLNAMGADIRGAGSPRITIRGVDRLHGCEHRVIPDRIEAGTFMAMAAITQGRLELTNCPLDALLAFEAVLLAAGVTIQRLDTTDPMRARCVVSLQGRPRPVEITTQPHPGFPTDLQAQTMALLTLADGNSVVTERIFPERFLHVAELARMGARLYRQGGTVIVSGVQKLQGAPVMASDLRASAGLVMAGLAAQGTTIVNRVYHLDRGYERLEQRLAPLGVSIERADERVTAV